MITENWTDILDTKIVQAFMKGRITGVVSGVPDSMIESGLAHVFFYGDKVYKLYKTYADKDHFIKGVLAPTVHREDFIARDFALNQHFSPKVYFNKYTVSYDAEHDVVVIGPAVTTSIYYVVEMQKLDFASNLHEQLLMGEVTYDDLHMLGRETGRAIHTCPVVVPETVNWYQLATARMDLLEQFINWMADDVRAMVIDSGALPAMRQHLERYEAEYREIAGQDLSVNVDNHDENVFFVDGEAQFIDLLPPMSSWWYGLPYANVSNLMINVEALMGEEAAQRVYDGYVTYVDAVPPTHRIGFTHAFAVVISIAHFSTVPGKEEVTDKYVALLPKVHEWL